MPFLLHSQPPKSGDPPLLAIAVMMLTFDEPQNHRWLLHCHVFVTCETLNGRLTANLILDASVCELIPL